MTPLTALFTLRAFSVVAGARNHLQANRPLEFWFEITI